MYFSNLVFELFKLNSVKIKKKLLLRWNYVESNFFLSERYKLTKSIHLRAFNLRPWINGLQQLTVSQNQYVFQQMN